MSHSTLMCLFYLLDKGDIKEWLISCIMAEPRLKFWLELSLHCL